jgi:hypothetical protein
MKTKTERIIIFLLFFLLVLTTGSVVHLVYGQFLSPIFFFLLLLLAINTKPINKNLLTKALTLQLLLTVVLFLNFLFVPFKNDLWFYFKIILRVLSVNLFLVLMINNNYNIIYLLYKALVLIAWLAIANMFLSPILIPISDSLVTNGLQISSFVYLFNYPFDHNINLLGISYFRNQSIFWEPGILQIYMNVLFIISAYIVKSKLYRWISIFIIFSTFSTTGLILLFFQLLMFYKNILKKNMLIILVVLFVIFPVLSYFIYDNILNKVYGVGVASADLRFFDFLSAIDFLKKYPITGIGLDMRVYVNEQFRITNKIMQDFTFNVYNTIGTRGSSNSTIFLFVGLGIPIASFYFYKLYNQTIIQKEKLLVFIIIVIANMSEPLITGNFFILFFLSSFYNKSISIRENQQLIN